jgi:hypothetical protein
MKELINYHKSNPLKVKLPSNDDGGSFIDVFIYDYFKVTESLRMADYEVYVKVDGLNKFTYLTKQIIKYYVLKSLNTQLKLFSLDSCIVEYKIEFS